MNVNVCENVYVCKCREWVQRCPVRSENVFSYYRENVFSYYRENVFSYYRENVLSYYRENVFSYYRENVFSYSRENVSSEALNPKQGVGAARPRERPASGSDTDRQLAPRCWRRGCLPPSDRYRA